MENKLNEIKGLIRKVRSTPGGFSENLNNIDKKLKEVVNIYSYS